MEQLYICKIHIENYRNFLLTDFELSNRQVIIGENSIGKSNLIRALQLILDPALSDEDRQLEETDFYEGLEGPMEKGIEIKIELYIDNFSHIKNVLCQLSDATVKVNGKNLLKLTYKFFPQVDLSGKKEYTYIIFKGDDEKKLFTHEDRKYINLRVIKAIRDVESEMRNSKSSPITKLIKQKYDIKKEDIKGISDALRDTGANTLNLPEVNDLQYKIKSLLNAIISYSKDEYDISLKTMDIDASRILYALRPLVNMREASNTSLGINNILYISLLLLLVEDDTIKTYLPSTIFNNLLEKEESDIVKSCYTESEKGFLLNQDLDIKTKQKLYDFMYEQNPSNAGVTILAIEEPEAHLHPIYQRLLYKYVVDKSNSPVIITTHSTHISSVAPINSIIHLIQGKTGTEVFTTAKINLADKEAKDLERYIDVKRGEIYLAKGIIFVEGIAEEYLIPSFAKIMGYELDRYGIIVCNINSTNFIPYKKFAEALSIPNVIITDGDYYHVEDKNKIFGDIHSDEYDVIGYAGNERAIDICGLFIEEQELEKIRTKDFNEQDKDFNQFGIFVGQYTFEVDILNKSNSSDKKIICNVFNELTDGGDVQKENFKNNINSGAYNKCLSAIESSHSQIGKGRFAQRLASVCTQSMIPPYVTEAIQFICKGAMKQID